MGPPLSLFNETPCLACAGSDLSPPPRPHCTLTALQTLHTGRSKKHNRGAAATTAAAAALIARALHRPQNLIVREIDAALPRDVVLAELTKACPPTQGRVVVPASDATGGGLGFAYLNYFNAADGEERERGAFPYWGQKGAESGTGTPSAWAAAPGARAQRPAAPALPCPQTQHLHQSHDEMTRPPPPPPTTNAANRALDKLRFSLAVRGRRVRVARAVEAAHREHVFGPYGLRFQIVVKVRARIAFLKRRCVFALCTSWAMQPRRAFLLCTFHNAATTAPKRPPS